MKTKWKYRGAVMVFLLAIAGSSGPLRASSPTAPVVEVEERVYTYEPANNGAGPMWCHGSTCLARIGDSVFATGLRTLPNAQPLNNCRWMLFHRGDAGWNEVWSPASNRTREPAPVAAFPSGRLFVSANPTMVEDPEAYAGPARPELYAFDPANPSAPPEVLRPVWKGNPEFTEHSYRSLAADGEHEELILFQNIGYGHAEWAFRDRQGEWSDQGSLRWPWGEDYAEPQPIRICYPNVALNDRAVYFCGVSDIQEPNPKWREYKKKLTGRTWDYDFRRLFFTWTPDIKHSEFRPWIEVASREATAGWITPGDLWVESEGTVHLLWTERALDERLRQKFFPEAKQSYALNYARLREGKVHFRRSLVRGEEGGLRPGRGRFHVTPDHRLFVFYYVGGVDEAGRSLSENRLVEIKPDGSSGAAVRVPLDPPFTDFFTATVRAGSRPAQFLDLLGPRQGNPQEIHYVRLRLP